MTKALRELPRLTVDRLWTLERSPAGSPAITYDGVQRPLLPYDRTIMRPELFERNRDPELALLFGLFSAAIDRRSSVTRDVATMRQAGKDFAETLASVRSAGQAEAMKTVDDATRFGNYVLRNQMNNFGNELRERARRGVHYFIGFVATDQSVRLAGLERFTLDAPITEEPRTPLPIYADITGRIGTAPMLVPQKVLYELNADARNE